MTGDIYLGKLFGIPFRLHWSWFLAVFLIAWTLSVQFFPHSLPEYQGEDGFYVGLGVLAALGLFVSVLLHELGHAVLALRFGVPVRGIRLFIFGGVAELGSEPKKPGHEILIALGGPAVTVLLVLVYQLVLNLLLVRTELSSQFSDGLFSFQGGGRAVAGTAALLFYLSLVNGMLLLFNMIPAFPLDGGRVLRGIIWAISGNYLNSTRIAGSIGIGFAWLLYIVGFWTVLNHNLLGGVWMFFLGTFLQNAATSSIAYAQLQQLLRGVHVADLMRPNPMTVDAEQSLRDIVDHYFLRYPYKAFPVLRQGQYVGMLSLHSVQQVNRDDWDRVHAGEVVEQMGMPALQPGDPLMQAVRKLAESGQSRLPVVQDGMLVGLLSRRDVMDCMEIRSGLTGARQQE